MHTALRPWIFTFILSLATLLNLSALTPGERIILEQGRSFGAIRKTSKSPAIAAQQNLSDTLQGSRFDRITTADGLSFPMVRQIIQDKQVLIWFATDDGLNNYDGYQFTVYLNNPNDPTSLGFNSVSALHVDRDGVIWVGGSGGLDRFDPQQNIFTHVDTNGPVYCIYEDRDGILWVGFWNGLFGYDRVSNQLLFDYHYDPTLPDDLNQPSSSRIQAILEDQDGMLWIGTSAGLDRLDRSSGVFTHFWHDPDKPASLSRNAINAIFEDHHGNLWIATDGGGLEHFQHSSETFNHYQYQPDDTYSPSSNTILSLLEDSNGNLWVGTPSGLNILERLPDRFIHIFHQPENPTSLSNDMVLSLYEDSAGVIWIGTANGISKYNGRSEQFIHYQKRYDPPGGISYMPESPTWFGISDDKVLAVIQDQQQLVWIGTFKGGVNRLNREAGMLTIYQPLPGNIGFETPGSLRSSQVGAINVDYAGIIWIGTGNGWLQQYKQGTSEFIDAHYLGETEITRITEDPTGNLWIGTGGEGLFRLDGDRKVLYNYPHFKEDTDHWLKYGSLSDPIVLDIFIDQFGVPWIGTYAGGLNLWDEDISRFKHFRHDPKDSNSLSHDHVLSIFEDPDQYPNIVWIGTGGGGLNRFDRATKTFHAFTTDDGLSANVVSCILSDQAGYLWLATPNGLSRFDPRKESFRNYNQYDGFGALGGGGVHPGACFRDSDGEMFFGGFDGLYVFDPETFQDNLHIPPIVITALNIANQTARRDLAPNEHIELTYKQNFLSFEFAALDYTISEKNQYAYKLENVDEDWVDAGTRRRADYPNLRPGEYIFRVKGANSDQIWNEQGTSISIRIAPPFWQTWGFRVFLAFVVVLGATAYYRQRMRGIEARRRDLEAQVEERTREIERRRQEVEVLYNADEELYRHLDLDRVLKALVDTAVTILQANKGALMVWNETHDHLVVQASRGFNPTTLSKIRFAPGEGVAGKVALSGEPITIEDTQNDPRVTKRVVQAEGIRSFLQVPIKIGGEIFGVFSADYLIPRTFSEDEVQLLLSLAQRAGLAIQNAQSYQQAQESAAVEERQRLARDLHDAVTQTLFSASLLAEALPAVWEKDHQQGFELLEDLRQLSRGALAEMRTLLIELRPAALEESSLKDLLVQLAQSATGREGIPVEVKIDNVCQLPVEVHIALYRIAQEALNNVVKHARASHVNISLRCASPPVADGELGTGVELCICDDGCGFDPERTPQNRLGIGIMHERATAIGALLKIDSKIGHGTVVRVIRK